MNCDRALILLATGGPLGRRRARRHASRCSHCAAEAARLDRIARELSAAEPLSAARRALWSAAGTDPRPEARPNRYRTALVAAAAVVLILAAIGLRLMTVPRGPALELAGGRPPDRPADVPRATAPETIRELDDLRSRFQDLSRELAQLRRRAELLDERRDADALSRRIGHPLAFNGP